MAGTVFHTPPRQTNYRGESRRVGIEIEFIGPSTEESAALVSGLFGGLTKIKDRHFHVVEGSRLGDFVCKLDLSYAHPSQAYDENESLSLSLIEQEMGELIGDASALLVPTEITCPPLLLEDLPQVQLLIGALRHAGARGTEENLAYAFGLHLNPEIAEKSAMWITAVLRAYLTLSDWLRAKCNIDLTRRLFRFTDPFPAAYSALVCDPDYTPNMSRLIDDYLAYNPTRNRELDMLPLFAWIDGERVRAKVGDPRIKARPALHYRLPDARLNDRGWSVADEWNRWVIVERIAEDAERLNQIAADFLDYRSRWLSGRWAEKAEKWIAQVVA